MKSEHIQSEDENIWKSQNNNFVHSKLAGATATCLISVYVHPSNKVFLTSTVCCLVSQWRTLVSSDTIWRALLSLYYHLYLILKLVTLLDVLLWNRWCFLLSWPWKVESAMWLLPMYSCSSRVKPGSMKITCTNWNGTRYIYILYFVNCL